MMTSSTSREELDLTGERESKEQLLLRSQGDAAQG
jgi:hypothetical protein